MIPEGLKACRQLVQDGHRVNVTLVFSPPQALLAAKAGATFVSPFVGRIDDAGQVGMDIVRQIRTIYQNYGFPTQLLVASIRHPIHVVEAALAGADIGTMPFTILQQLVKHPLTDVGLKKFLADWERVPRQ
jgi:transaldolase